MVNKKHHIKAKRRRFKISAEEKAHHEIKKKEIVERINAALNEGTPEQSAEPVAPSQKEQEVVPPTDTSAAPLAVEAENKAATPPTPSTEEVKVSGSEESSLKGTEGTEVSAQTEKNTAPVTESGDRTQDVGQEAEVSPEEQQTTTSNAEQLASNTPTAEVKKEEAKQPISQQPSSDESASVSGTQPPWRNESTGEQIIAGPPSKRKLLWVILIPVLIGVILIDGYIIYTKLLSKEPTKIEKLPLGSTSSTKNTPVPPTPTPTEKPIDLAKYEIQVLNGSGVKGLAAKVSSTLKSDGFTVGLTGNADNSNYTETVIRVKKDVPATYIKKLNESLSVTYKVAKSTEELKDTAETDVVVVIGSEEAP